MEHAIRNQIEDLTKEIDKIENKIKKLADKISTGVGSDKDIANLMELANQKRERQYATYNLYQILGKASQ